MSRRVCVYRWRCPYLVWAGLCVGRVKGGSVSRLWKVCLTSSGGTKHHSNGSLQYHVHVQKNNLHFNTIEVINTVLGMLQALESLNGFHCC